MTGDICRYLEVENQLHDVIVDETYIAYYVISCNLM